MKHNLTSTKSTNKNPQPHDIDQQQIIPAFIIAEKTIQGKKILRHAKCTSEIEQNPKASHRTLLNNILTQAK